MIIKNGKRIFVPVEEKQDYVQNEEQDDTTMWQKTKELDIPEPEKNEIDLVIFKSLRFEYSTLNLRTINDNNHLLNDFILSKKVQIRGNRLIY